MIITLVKSDEPVDKTFYGYQDMVAQNEVDPYLDLPGLQNKKYFFKNNVV